MTNPPYAADPHTLDDLLRSKISVFMLTNDRGSSLSDPTFNRVFKFRDRVPSMDFTNKNIGYCSTSNHIMYGINHPSNYDQQQMRSKLVILNEFSMGVFVPCYFMGFRNPLKSRLHKTELLFYETGLMGFWTRRVFRYIFGEKYSQLIKDTAESDGCTLETAELGPIFRALVIGLLLATLVFVFEYGYNYLSVYVRAYISKLKQCLYQNCFCKIWKK